MDISNFGFLDDEVVQDELIGYGYYAGLDILAPLRSRLEKEIYYEHQAPDETGDSFLKRLTARSFISVEIGKLSQEGINHIVEMETGGRSYYENVYKGRPVWPAGASGVTIGVGYDLGYVGQSQFKNDWSNHLPSNQFTSLSKAVGKRKSDAKKLISGLRGISIPFEVAVQVFMKASLPQYLGYTYEALGKSGMEGMHPHCRSAMVSLVFNRGADKFKSPGNRYAEMREIYRLVQVGDYGSIPAQLRSMKRLWINSGALGVVRHREKEAQLFELGLSQMDLNDPMALATLDTLEPEFFLIDTRPSFLRDRKSRSSISSSSVYWPSHYKNCPDYRHISKDYSGVTFDLDADLVRVTLKALRCKLNGDYNPSLVIAIRGACLASGADHEEGKSRISVVETRPDHRDFKCLMGVVEGMSGEISLYDGSTVPNAYSVARYYNYMNGSGRVYMANCLPTGFYDYHVGSHYGKAGTIPHVLRQGNGPKTSDASTVTVLRSEDDGAYGTQDDWDKSTPRDNIHPAQKKDGFSSAGCLTVKGNYDSSTGHKGLWQKFQKRIGLTNAARKEMNYHVLLISGMELAEIAELRSEHAEIGWRLRHGSQGDEVKRLQRAIGLNDDGDFGPDTKLALTQLQKSQLGFATGIADIAMLNELGIGFAYV